MADTITTDLGPVTAYADAVKHGYTGTREDFGKLLAGAGKNLEDAVEASNAAETAAENAENAAQTATDAAGTAGQAAGVAAQSAEAAETAQQSAEDAAKKALEAKTGAENALKDADTAKDAASGYADAATESATAAAASATNAAANAKSASDAAQKIEDSAEKIDKNAAEVSQLKEDKLNKPESPVVGQLLRVKSISDTGEITLETVAGGGGSGLPEGGTPGQILAKKSATNGDTQWVDPQTSTVRTALDDVAVAGAKYFLGEQTELSITMPDDAQVGQEIMVVFSSGETACTLAVDLDDFDFVPKANATCKLVFLCVATETWLVDAKEG